MRLFTLGTGAMVAALFLAGSPTASTGSASGGTPGSDVVATRNTLTIVMAGPTAANPGTGCNWYAYPVNGTYPYTYQWYAYGLVEEGVFGGMWRGYTIRNTAGTLQVLVTDANGQTGWGTIGVYGSTNVAPCTD
jgi:hypothetical protein